MGKDSEVQVTQDLAALVEADSGDNWGTSNQLRPHRAGGTGVILKSPGSPLPLLLPVPYSLFLRDLGEEAGAWHWTGMGEEEILGVLFPRDRRRTLP